MYHVTMASGWRLFKIWSCSRCFRLLPCLTSQNRSSKFATTLFTTSGVLWSAQFVSQKESEQEKIQIKDPAVLTHSYLVKNASSVTVDGAVTLLRQTVTSILDIEEQYTDALRRLCQLININMEVLGTGNPEDKVWDALIQVRAQVADLKKQRQDLHLLLSSVERLLHAAAETSFLTGEEFPSMSANETLQTAKLHVDQARRRSEALEEQVQLLDVQMIEETTRQAEEKLEEELEEETSDEDITSNDNETS